MLQKSQQLNFLLKNILLIIQIQHRQYPRNLKQLIVNFDRKNLAKEI